nr:uncharacterized protein LOC131764992 isoform X1 [Kogia breviceps]
MRRVGRARGISNFCDLGAEVGQPSFHFLQCCLSFPSDPAHAESRDPAERMSSPSHQVTCQTCRLWGHGKFVTHSKGSSKPPASLYTQPRQSPAYHEREVMLYPHHYKLCFGIHDSGGTALSPVHAREEQCGEESRSRGSLVSCLYSSLPFHTGFAQIRQNHPKILFPSCHPSTKASPAYLGPTTSRVNELHLTSKPPGSCLHLPSSLIRS